MSDEVKVSQRYRELATEEPPRALDEAILAAAQRSARPWTRRWAVPLSLAAVVVLSVTVTLRMQYEQPDLESPAPSAPPAKPPPVLAENMREQLPLKAERQIKSAPAPAREQRAKLKPQDEPRPFAPDLRDRVAAVPPPAAAPAPARVAPAPEAAPASRADALRGAESSVAGTVARQAEERTARDAEAASRAPQVGPVQALAKRAEADGAGATGSVSAKPAAASPRQAARAMPLEQKTALLAPEQELERIAQLRRDGRHDEADKALAEFRKRHPDYRIPEAMLERVERR